VYSFLWYLHSHPTVCEQYKQMPDINF
jgi:hypothetical protein